MRVTVIDNTFTVHYCEVELPYAWVNERFTMFEYHLPYSQVVFGLTWEFSNSVNMLEVQQLIFKCCICFLLCLKFDFYPLVWLVCFVPMLLP